jgi:hypothetical protein
MLALWLGRARGTLSAEQGAELLKAARELPRLVEDALAPERVARIKEVAEKYALARDYLFLGRGVHYPIALEGALKLKEISYIHAEAYPAGELKHGPLALVDKDMPVITIAPNDQLIEKLKSNMQEVRARGGELYVFADPESGFEPSDGVHVIEMPRHVTYFQAPAVRISIALLLSKSRCIFIFVWSFRKLGPCSGYGGLAGAGGLSFSYSPSGSTSSAFDSLFAPVTAVPPRGWKSASGEDPPPKGSPSAIFWMFLNPKDTPLFPMYSQAKALMDARA